jgi:hypothetical protein
MLNFKKMPVTSLYNILRATPKYREVVENKEEKSWNDVVKVIDLLGIQYTNEQLHYVKQQDWDK